MPGGGGTVSPVFACGSQVPPRAHLHSLPLDPTSAWSPRCTRTGARTGVRPTNGSLAADPGCIRIRQASCPGRNRTKGMKAVEGLRAGRGGIRPQSVSATSNPNGGRRREHSENQTPQIGACGEGSRMGSGRVRTDREDRQGGTEPEPDHRARSAVEGQPGRILSGRISAKLVVHEGLPHARRAAGAPRGLGRAPGTSRLTPTG